MKTSFSYIVLLLAAVFVFSSCKKDDPIDPTTEMVELAHTHTASDWHVTVYAMDSIKVGYNKLYISVKEDHDTPRLTDATVMLMPMMDMMTMSHSAPAEQPGAADADGFYVGAVVFVMPTDPAMGTWTVTLSITRNGVTESVDVPLEVASPAYARMRSLTAADDSSKLFLSLVAPADPIVGINDFEITAHQRVSMMSWPAVNDLTFEIVPEMPSMGHGSPNNVNPVIAENGHYKGKVNFTMDGEWVVHVNMTRAGKVVGTVDYTINFQAK